MKLTCNGEPLELDVPTLTDLLSWRLDDPRPTGIAVAVNDEVVPRDDWSRWALADGDVIEIVTAVQGG